MTLLLSQVLLSVSIGVMVSLRFGNASFCSRVQRFLVAALTYHRSTYLDSCTSGKLRGGGSPLLFGGCTFQCLRSFFHVCCLSCILRDFDLPSCTSMSVSSCVRWLFSSNETLHTSVLAVVGSFGCCRSSLQR